PARHIGRKMAALTRKPPLRFRVQAAALWAAIRLLRTLGPASASNLGGFVLRTIGPWLPVSEIADTNLRHAMPELDSAGRRRVIRGVWDNLGRTAAELPHLGALQQTAEGGPGWECSNYEALQTLQARGVPALLFSGH